MSDKQSTRTDKEESPSGLAQTLQLAYPSSTPQEEAASLAAPPYAEERYEELRVLGQGGMGRVLEARDRQFGRVVALKELRPDRVNERTKGRFQLEALVTGNLEHPGIAAVYERGIRADGSPFYAMRRVEGRTLEEAILEAKDIKERLRLLSVITRIAQTVGFAHERGVIHRDIKPQNIIVGRYGEVVLLDWGIAKVRGLSGGRSPWAEVSSQEGMDSIETRAGSVMGTPAYMAPEQAKGELHEIDERTDVFALGALLYHLLSGRQPYSGQDALQDAAVGRFPSLETIAKEAPLGLREICKKAMSVGKEGRYPSATSMAEALENFNAEAALRGGRSTIDLTAVFMSFVVLLGLFASTLVTFSQISSLQEQGFHSLTTVLIAVFGVSLSGIEWYTRGRYSLSPLCLALAVATLFYGFGQAGLNIGIVTERLLQDEVFINLEEFRLRATSGLYELSGGVALSGTLAALQIACWGIARRRSLLKDK